MPLITTEVFERAKRILYGKIGNNRCTTCGNVERTLHPRIFSIPDIPDIPVPMSSSPIDTGVIYIDLMFTTCDNCGHVDFYNAHQLEALKGEGT